MPKHYYQIGEVANMLGVKAHTLRYWEGEFPRLKPRKNSSGKRSYTKDDIEVLKKIKYLLYDQNFSIEGARKKMENNSDDNIPAPTPVYVQPPSEIKNKLKSRLEKIQDIISLSPSAEDKLNKKREIKSKIHDIKILIQATAENAQILAESICDEELPQRDVDDPQPDEQAEKGADIQQTFDLF